MIGTAGLTGTFARLYQAIPGPAILPILVFIGLEITAQSFHAPPRRHHPAAASAGSAGPPAGPWPPPAGAP